MNIGMMIIELRLRSIASARNRCSCVWVNDAATSTGRLIFSELPTLVGVVLYSRDRLDALSTSALPLALRVRVEDRGRRLHPSANSRRQRPAPRLRSQL